MKQIPRKTYLNEFSLSPKLLNFSENIGISVTNSKARIVDIPKMTHGK